MRKISPQELFDPLYTLLLDLPVTLRQDVIFSIQKVKESETSERNRQMLDLILQNADVAASEKIPLCQDTGAVSVFLEVGLDVSFEVDPARTIDRAVREAFSEGSFRPSIARDAFLDRTNTADNTPAFVSAKLVPGSSLKVDVLVKGGGCDNASAIMMMRPTASATEVADAVAKVIINAGPNACPPFVVGVMLGGSFDTAPSMAKKLLMRDLASPALHPALKELEDDITSKVNASHIGAGGFGGDNTLLRVFVETAPSHIASLPVAVNISCHSLRSGSIIL